MGTERNTDFLFSEQQLDDSAFLFLGYYVLTLHCQHDVVEALLHGRVLGEVEPH